MQTLLFCFHGKGRAAGVADGGLQCNALLPPTARFQVVETLRAGLPLAPVAASTMQARQARFQDIVAQVRATRPRDAECSSCVISKVGESWGPARSRRSFFFRLLVAGLVFQYRPGVAANAGTPPIFAARRFGPGTALMNVEKKRWSACFSRSALH